MPKRKQDVSASEKSSKKRSVTEDQCENDDSEHGNNVLKSEAKESKATNKDGHPYDLKITSWNVAGVRALAKKDGVKWLESDDADIVCLQECKCSEKDIPQYLLDFKNKGYKLFWNESKSTKGHSGVGMLTKLHPKDITFGIGVKDHDEEGRTITAEFDRFYIVTTYVPNSQRKLARLDYRMKWNEDFKKYITKLDQEKPVILCGDMNVSHQEIDLANPKSNKRNAGFTQEERDGMTDLLNGGFVDSFRELYPDLKGQYTFWTYMGNARARNVGWRLDYFIVSKRLMNHVCDNVILSSVLGSDHCPISLLFTRP